jgi:drug/metabolite transporter (DMT)-like permease
VSQPRFDKHKRITLYAIFDSPLINLFENFHLFACEVIGGSVMFGCVLGAVWLNELLAVQGWIGVGFVVLGIVLVATDPASGLGE